MPTRSLELRLDYELITGSFLQRLNRFMIEVAIDNRNVLAHLPNSGRLTTVLVPNTKVFLKKISQNRTRRRKSMYDVFAVKTRVSTIVDTRFSSFLAETAVENELFKSFRGYRVKHKNFRVGNSLLDLKLEKGGKAFFVEVKSVTHVIDGTALFPDAPTQRGARHVQLLTRLRRAGYKVGIFFSVQRSDAKVLRLNRKVDPKFSSLLEEAVKKGVEVFIQTAVFRQPNIIRIFPNSPRFEL